MVILRNTALEELGQANKYFHADFLCEVIHEHFSRYSLQFLSIPRMIWYCNTQHKLSIEG